MYISAKLDYSCKALLELALHWPNVEPLPISVISKHQQIPVKFLTQILLNLKQHGFVQSTRGKDGGYTLAQSPQDIKLSDVFYKINEENNPRKTKADQEVFSRLWKDIDSCLFNKLQAITFESILQDKRNIERTMSFQI